MRPGAGCSVRTMVMASCPLEKELAAPRLALGAVTWCPAPQLASLMSSFPPVFSSKTVVLNLFNAATL